MPIKTIPTYCTETHPEFAESRSAEEENYSQAGVYVIVYVCVYMGVLSSPCAWSQEGAGAASGPATVWVPGG